MLRRLALALSLAVPLTVVSVLAEPAHAAVIDATLEQSVSSVAPGSQITYTLKFHNTTDNAVQIDPLFVGFTAPAGTTRVAASHDFGAVVPPNTLNYAVTLTVRVEVVPNGTVIVQRPTPTTNGDPILVTPDHVDATVIGSSWSATSASIDVSTTSVRYPDEQVTVSGSVLTNGTPFARRVVHLMADTGSGPTTVASVTTTDTGSMQATVRPARGTKYSWRADNVVSATKLVKVELLVQVKKVKTASGNKLKVKLGPAVGGVKLKLQKIVKKHWKVVASKTSKAGGKSSFTVRESGRYRVHVPAGSGWDSSYSRVVRVPSSSSSGVR